MRTLSLRRPDDWHVHLRDGDVLPDTVNATAKHFARALVMPNLIKPLTSIEAMKAYRHRILAAVDKKFTFTPYMTFYLNQNVSGDDLILAKKDAFILGAKLYPQGATTNAEHGPAALTSLYPLLDTMQANNLVLQIHGETSQGDIFEREARFLTENLTPIIKQFPKLRIVLEHISTQAAVEFIQQTPANVSATITPHHLLYNRNHLLAGGVRPHYYCLPILKKEDDQLALQQAVASGNPKFFAGTDSAPHAKSTKENTCGCAGIFSAPYALAMYAEVFEKLGCLEKLEAFTSHFGAQFYELPLNETPIELVNQSQVIPTELSFGQTHVVPAGAGTTLQWSVHD